jgi:NADH-quinone oxidoreductase subunit L
MELIWLIPLLPGLGAAVTGLLGIRFFSKTQTTFVACTSMALSALLSIYAFVQLLALPTEARVYDVVVAPWIPAIPLETASGIGEFAVDWGFRLDPLSGMMILIVSGIGLLIHLYSTSYMHGESAAGYARFFCYLNLFCFFMLTLVLGSNLLVMFVGWEGVGLCSYLLIGFWYHKQSATDAGKKAFLVNRIGDWGFLLGIFLIFFTFGTIDFQEVMASASAMPIEATEFGVISLICLLLFVGATGKSAQIPLYVWLPDAMEGPTPVSALIHAATMVTAGVYMVCRTATLFTHAPMVMTVVAVIGALTALMAASIGLLQTDIKRVLAYSTVSQLGYMFLATGVGAFGAAVFHLMTHAFFKALLFLGSGSVIHAMDGEQDMRAMGGLKLYMPVTFVTMLVGTLAIAGIPPFAGFFSKDEILFQAFLHNRALWVIAVLTAGMTSFYMFRLMAMTFYGKYRGPAWESSAVGHDGADRHGADAEEEVDDGHGAWHGPHESPAPMTGTLTALAIGAIVAGFVGIPVALGGSNAIEHFLEPSFVVSADHVVGEASGVAVVEAEGEHEISHGVELGLMVLSIFVALGGLALAHRLYLKQPELAEAWKTRWAGVHQLLFNKYYVDEVYQGTVVRGTMSSGRGLWRFDSRVVDGAVNGSSWLTLVFSWCSGLFDRYVVDGAVNLVGWAASESSFSLRRIQTGLIQNYALTMLFGVFVFVSLYLLVS